MAQVSVVAPTYRTRRSLVNAFAVFSPRPSTTGRWWWSTTGLTTAPPIIAEWLDDPRIAVLRRPHEGASGLGRAYASALAVTACRSSRSSKATTRGLHTSWSANSSFSTDPPSSSRTERRI